jgi:hypothetical protein
MHGRVLFPTYRDFQQFMGMTDNIADFIGHLDAYNALPAIESPVSV